MRKHVSTVILILIFLIGLSLLLYPTVSDYWNSLHQSQAIRSYEEKVAQMTDEEDEAMWKAAREFNARLLQKRDPFKLTDEEKEEYNSLLNLDYSGMMGYIEIPAIDVKLPLYHGTSEPVLQIGVGHIEGSSMPVGGESSHAALSGHRGLPSSKLFTDLDRINPGDRFLIHIFGHTMAYEVDQLLVVLPTEMEALEIEQGKDYCTLVTCTPYGVNSHRILVRGVRTDYKAALDIRVTADAYLIDAALVAPFLAIPLIMLLVVWVIFTTGKAAEKKKIKRLK